MGIGDVALSLFGECPLQQEMHFCGMGHVWPELVDPETRTPMDIEAGAVGELVYTHLTRQAMPVLRFLGGDIVRIEGTSCGCGRTSFRMRCLGRRDDVYRPRGSTSTRRLAEQIEAAVRARLIFRCKVELVSESLVGDSGYKTGSR